MSEAFEFLCPRVIFGPGKLSVLPSLLQELLPPSAAPRILLVTGSTMTRAQPLLDLLRQHFSTLHAEVLHVAREPQEGDVLSGLSLCASLSPSLVVAVGGGAVIDCAKAVAMLAENGGELIDYLEVIGRGKPITRPSLPLIAVPTTAGAGAEVTKNAVITVPSKGLKVSLRANTMLPTVALIDPSLAQNSPLPVTLSTGLDALTQCIEPLVSPFATPLTDAVAREGLLRGARALRLACSNLSELSPRIDMAVCALNGGIALANGKLGIVHGIAGVVGGRFNAPHGMLCAALLAKSVEVNIRACRQRGKSETVRRYQIAAECMTGKFGAEPEESVDWIRALCLDLGVPGLGSYGLKTEDAELLSEFAAKASSTKGNPVELAKSEIAEIIIGSL